jgi:quinol monooxygenase YgiN
MFVGRRQFILGSAATLGTTASGFALPQESKHEMFGLIGQMIAVPGQQDALISILLEGTHDMPGCLSYIVAKDTSDQNAIWITEVWDSEASHRASLSLPQVKNAITRGKPLIAQFANSTTTKPVGGHGLQKAG